MRLFYQPCGGCQPALSFTDGSFPGPMQTDFLGTISYPPALGRSELGQGLNRFLDRAANSTWSNKVCWSRLVAVNRIAIMMDFLDFHAHFD